MLFSAFLVSFLLDSDFEVADKISLFLGGMSKFFYFFVIFDRLFYLNNAKFLLCYFESNRLNLIFVI